MVVETAEFAYKAGRFTTVPLIIGNCSGEIGGQFVSNATTKETFFAQFDEYQNEAKFVFDPDGNKEFSEIQTKFNTEWVWGEPARMTARSFIKKTESCIYFSVWVCSCPGKRTCKVWRRSWI
ncbi:MAG: hypothetical protein ACO3FI_11205 [Cyclobacteriaceae bacterium]